MSGGFVLILVLMEDTLRGDQLYVMLKEYLVLILVLMEDTLRGNKSMENLFEVLILVLMEDTLREQRLVFLCLSLFDVCLPL